MLDAARLVEHGEVVVFGASALAFWMQKPPVSRDVDVWCDPPERGHAVVALMGELSWYHDRHGVFVEVWAPETFAAPSSWRERARTFRFEGYPDVAVVVPHPHDVMLAKLERMDVKDREHLVAILAEYPLSLAQLAHLELEMPHRTGAIAADRKARIEGGLQELRVMIGRPG